MAAKHDGKRAAENHWVMQQNMARQKGGGGFKPKAPAPRVKPVPPKPAPVAAPDAETKPEGTS